MRLADKRTRRLIFLAFLVYKMLFLLLGLRHDLTTLSPLPPPSVSPSYVSTFRVIITMMGVVLLDLTSRTFFSLLSPFSTSLPCAISPLYSRPHDFLPSLDSTQITDPVDLLTSHYLFHSSLMLSILCIPIAFLVFSRFIALLHVVWRSACPFFCAALVCINDSIMYHHCHTLSSFVFFVFL